MNLTVSPLNYNNQKTAFKANTSRIAEETVRSATSDSRFFSGFEKKYDEFTSSVAKNVTSRLLEFEPLQKLAEHFKHSKKLYQHSMTTGSVITSGLYMQRTLANKDMDNDRKKTLAVNQGLTLILSTAGAYMLDKYLTGWWDNVTARYAGILLNDKDFYQNYRNQKEEAAKANKPLLEAMKRGEKVKLKESKGVLDMVKANASYKRIMARSADDAKILRTKVKGMSPLKAIIVFGFVYRYFVPVVVTKPANKLCDMYLERKKAKENAQQA